MNIIFTDGSSRGNPGPGGWGAIVVLNDQVTEIGGREYKTTNNRMELTAVIEALKFLKNEKGKFRIYTDSSYVLNGITLWIKSWIDNKWMTKVKKPVLNSDLWQELLKVTETEVKRELKWVLVKGHAGIPGNSRCDQIATAFADKKAINLYKGNIDKYRVDIAQIIPSMGTAGIKKSSKKGSAYSYVSKVDGVIKTDKSWIECEKRVKGEKGAKYKKVFSKVEESNLINDWSKSS